MTAKTPQQRKNIIDKQATNFVYEVGNNQPLEVKWLNDSSGTFEIVGEDPFTAPLSKPSSKEELEALIASQPPIISPTTLGDDIVSGIANAGDFKAAYDTAYNKAPKEQIDALIPYIKAVFGLKQDPSNYFTNFEGAKLGQPKFFSQKDWDNAEKEGRIIGGNIFGWAKDIEHRIKIEPLQALELGDDVLEYLARLAIGESAAKDLAGQKAVIDVIFTRAWHPNSRFKSQVEKGKKPKNIVQIDKKINIGFFHKAIDNVKMKANV